MEVLGILIFDVQKALFIPSALFANKIIMAIFALRFSKSLKRAKIRLKRCQEFVK
jgi:hypothetical protein